MNPITMLRVYTRARRLLSLLEQGTRSYERTHDMSKSLFASKTFWFNVVTAAVELTGVLPVPAGVSTAVVGVGNIVLRLLTNKPAHVL
jgi:hypothetical protein